MRSKDNSIVCNLIEKHGQYVIEYIPYKVSRASFHTSRHRYNSWTSRRPSKADALTWHLRLGHPEPEAMEHLVNKSKGVRLKGILTDECDDCACAKARRTIRREPRAGQLIDNPGIHLAADFHDFMYEETTDYYTSVMLVTDRFSGFIWDFYFYSRTADAIKEALLWLFKILSNQYQMTPQVLECDNELARSDLLSEFMQQQCGMTIEPSAPHTQSQIGGAERSGV